MDRNVWCLYMDFFHGCILNNDVAGIDYNGHPEYGIGSRTRALSMKMIYPLRHLEDKMKTTGSKP